MEFLIELRKGLLACFVLLLSFSLSYGQTWDEIFKQKKTQLKYSLKQIAGLGMYAEFLKEGYQAVNEGLNTVKDITNGEFNLHSLFINSLKTISPIIRKDLRIPEIIALQIEIRNSLKNSHSNSYLSASIQNYISAVKGKILEECIADLDELFMILTSGKYELKDEERLNRLEKVYASMKDKARVAQSFSGSVNILERQKENDQESDNQLRRYYENE